MLPEKQSKLDYRKIEIIPTSTHSIASHIAIFTICTVYVLESCSYLLAISTHLTYTENGISYFVNIRRKMFPFLGWYSSLIFIFDIYTLLCCIQIW